jgi:hypothetical protein
VTPGHHAGRLSPLKGFSPLFGCGDRAAKFSGGLKQRLAQRLRFIPQLPRGGQG